MKKDLKFHNSLKKWYLKNHRVLPWRQTTDPYAIWLSEIIMQQTKIEQGLPYFNKFITKYPSVKDLAYATEEEVLKLWQGLGYYSRARNLHHTAQYISQKLDGNFPETHKELIKLKGVGDYTASAIASFSFKEIEPVVDGNVYRFFSRYFGIETPINSSKAHKEFKEIGYQLISDKEPDIFNQAIMEFGATICTPKKPSCSSCVFNDSCYALAHKKIDLLPIKLKKMKIKKRYFNYIVPFNALGKTQLNKRTEKGIWFNLYEFPCIESNRILDISNSNIFDNLKDLEPEEAPYNFYNEVKIHKLSHQHLFVIFWIVKSKKSDLNVDWKDIEDYPVPILIHNFIKDYNNK